MLLFRPPTLAKISTIYMYEVRSGIHNVSLTDCCNFARIILTCLCQFVFAQQSHDSDSSQSTNTTEPVVVCRPFGACEPCKDDAVCAFQTISLSRLNVLVTSFMNHFVNPLAIVVSCIALMRLHLHLPHTPPSPFDRDLT